MGRHNRKQDEDMRDEGMVVVLGLLLMEKSQINNKEKTEKKILEATQTGLFLFTLASLFLASRLATFHSTSQITETRELSIFPTNMKFFSRSY